MKKRVNENKFIIRKLNHRYSLKKWVKLVFTSVVVTASMCLVTPVTALQFDSSNHSAMVQLPNTEYVLKTIDINIKVLGGEVALERSWINGRWYLNPSWSNLRFINDVLDGGIGAIDRAGTHFERSGNENIYTASKSYIQKTENGWRWYNKNGDWIIYDESGRMTAYGDRNDIRVDFVLDEEGRRTAVKDHHGETIYTFEYNTNELLTKVTDKTGRTVQYHWVGELLEKVTDVRGFDWQYQYDSNGQLIQRIEPDNGVIQIGYAYSVPAPKPVMTSSKDAGGVVSGSLSSTKKNNTDGKIARVSRITEKTGAVRLWGLDYDRSKKQYTVNLEDANGRKSVITYDVSGKKISTSINEETQQILERDGAYQKKTIDARGITTATQYDHENRPIKTIHPDGTVEAYEYDNNLNKLIRYVDRQGVVSSIEYDLQGNVTKLILAEGLSEEKLMYWTHDYYGQLVKFRLEAQGNEIELHQAYDTSGNISSVTDGSGNTYTYSYNDLGFLTGVTNPLGNTWVTEYDAVGNVVRSINPLGHSYYYVTDSMGRIIQTTNELGYSSNLSYEPSHEGWKVIQMDALNQSTTYQYDLVGNLASMTSPSGEVTAWKYDDKGRLVENVDPDGNRVQHEYGAPGSGLEGLIASTLYPTYREDNKYNLMGLPTQVSLVLSDSSVLKTYFSYNEQGDVVGITDATGRTMLHEYDINGNRINTRDFSGGEVKQSWDIWGNLSSVTDAKGNTHRFEYDKNNNLVKEVTPSGEITSYIYDVVEQLIQTKDAVGNISEYEYDVAGQHIKTTFTGSKSNIPEQIITYTYDKSGQMLEAFKKNNSDGGIDTRYVYVRDELGRLIQEEIIYSHKGRVIVNTLQYAYDAENRKTSIVYPDGSIQVYDYTVGGHLKTVQRPDRQSINLGAYEWRQATQIDAPGVRQTLSYDALQRLTYTEVKGQNNETLISRSNTYDKAGNIIFRTTEDGDYRYDYDLLDRLIQAIPPLSVQDKNVPVESYSYDAVHNRLGSSHQAGEWLYNEDNQLLKFGIDNDKTIYTYTPNGHVATETKNAITKVYYYDATDRLVRVANKVVGNEVELARYAYDYMGRRISKTVNGTTTYFLYSGEGLLAELNERGEMIRAYGWGADTMYGTKPLWQAELDVNNKLSDARFYTLITDHLGAPQIAVNNQGVVAWKALSDSFGQLLLNPQNQLTVNLRFAGQYFDEETGINYNYFRHYDPAAGRYLQKDPIGLMGGINWYDYVKANPQRFYDPLGLKITGTWLPPKYLENSVSGWDDINNYSQLKKEDTKLTWNGKWKFMQVQLHIQGKFELGIKCEERDDCDALIREWEYTQRYNVNGDYRHKIGYNFIMTSINTLVPIPFKVKLAMYAVLAIDGGYDVYKAVQAGRSYYKESAMAMINTISTTEACKRGLPTGESKFGFTDEIGPREFSIHSEAPSYPAPPPPRGGSMDELLGRWGDILR